MSPTYIPSTPISTSLSGGSVASDRTTLPKPTHPSDNSSDNSEETSLAAEAIASSPDEQNSREAWSIEQSEELYRIKGWGEPYFSINAAGNITVSPQGDRGGSLESLSARRRVKAKRLSATDSHSLFRDFRRSARAVKRLLCQGESPAIATKVCIKAFFPVKCNQQRHIVEDLARFGKPYQFGLEAGTKPELMIAMASLDTPGSLIICNGYKDDAYLETAMLGQRLGQKIIIVLEQVEEVDVAIALSQRLGIQPVLGVRAKLAAKGSGRWGESAGDRAKFGLSIPEIITVVEKLEAANMLPCLQLLHFHIGSQVSAISVIKDALREACQIYVELVKLGAPMGYLDVGGGLGVDYDGSKTSSQGSKNYSIQNYANDVVAEVKDACSAQAIPMPTLVSESGRAIASHQSVLIFDILGTSEATSYETPKPYVEGEHRLIRELWDLYTSLSPENYQEAFNDAVQFKKRSRRSV